MGPPPNQHKNWGHRWSDSANHGRDLHHGWDGFTHPGALSLSAVLFFWQFPHFYALAHRRRDDYLRAGYKMLPQTNPKSAQRWSLGSALALWPICIGSYMLDFTGHVFLVASTLANILLTAGAIPFYQRMKSKEAIRLFQFSLVSILAISFYRRRRGVQTIQVLLKR